VGYGEKNWKWRYEMAVKKICELWKDVFDASLDEHLAPELGELLLGKKSIYTDPFEFFSRTYLSDSILASLENIVKVFEGRGGNNTFTIYSLFGGGKTHTLFAIYHAIRNPGLLEHDDVLKGYTETKVDRIKRIADDLKNLKDVQIAVIYGKEYEYSGRPSAPLDSGSGAYRIYTLWGYLAHSLGSYTTIRKDDENLTVPDESTLRKVIGDRPTLILVDEIVDYAYGLKNSKIKEERDYVDSIPSFFDRLAGAVIGTKTALIVTLPIELKGKIIEKTETWYPKDFVKRYWTAIHRVSAKDLPALRIAGGEIIDVIKKRNFKKIDEEKVEETVRDFEQIYKQNREEVFGSYDEIIRKVRNTYPYHPDLIEILMEIVKRAELQKTRDLLKLTRKILRNVWNSNDDPYAIMPWHLDVARDEFHGDLFRGGSLADYSGVIAKDIIEDPKNFDKSAMIKKIATVIFLKTYMYDSPIPLTNFPTSSSIARMVYEQEFFLNNKWSPTAIIDALEEIKEKSYMYHLQTKDGKYWFWRIASVKEQIESEAKKFLEEDRDKVEDKVAEYVETLVKGETPTKKKKKKKELGIKVLRENTAHVTRNLNEEIVDNKTYKTIFLVNEDVNEEACKRIIFRYKDSERTYKNTIICVSPLEESYSKCTYHAARILGCEKTKKELPELYPDMEEGVLKVQESMIRNILDVVEDDLVRQIYSTFKKISYPDVEREKKRPILKAIDAVEGGSTLLEQTYLALTSPHVAKIAESMNFDALCRHIRNVVGIDIGENASKKIGEVKELFTTNVAFQMVEDSDIEEAIRKGVEDLSIGICNDDIWYKKIYEEELPIEDIGNVPPVLEDEYKILPWKEALKRQVDRLLDEKEVRGLEETTKIRYEIQYEGSLYPLQKITEQDDWEEIVRQGSIIRKRETVKPLLKDFQLIIPPNKILAKPGEELEVEVKIIPLKDVKGEIEVKLYVDSGEIVPSGGKLPLACRWRLVVPEWSGMKSIKISAESTEQKKSELLMLTIKSKVISTRRITSEHIGMNLMGVFDVKDLDILKEINLVVNSQKKAAIASGKMQIEEEEKNLNISLTNLNAEVSEYLFSQVKDLIEGETSVDLKVDIPEGVKVDEVISRKLSPYNERAEFKLRKKEENGGE
jgi:hypothetical protein